MKAQKLVRTLDRLCNLVGQPMPACQVPAIFHRRTLFALQAVEAAGRSVPLAVRGAAAARSPGLGPTAREARPSPAANAGGGGRLWVGGAGEARRVGAAGEAGWGFGAGRGKAESRWSWAAMG
jgi:hypothetical protein